LPQTDQEKHRALCDDLIGAFKYGTPEEIIGKLKKLEYLDGEAFNILVRLICGDKKLRPLFQNRLEIVRWSAGKPKSLASTPFGEAYIISVLRMARRRGKPLKGQVARRHRLSLRCCSCRRYQRLSRRCVGLLMAS
jgi:hypothetical protein